MSKFVFFPLSSRESNELSKKEKTFLKLEKRRSKLSEKIKQEILNRKINNKFYEIFAGAVSDFEKRE